MSLTESMSTITEMNSKIAESTEHQNQRLVAVNAHVNKMTGVSAQALNTVNMVAACGTEFRTMSAQLRNLVDQFLLSHGDPSIDTDTNANTARTSPPKAELVPLQSTDDVELF